MHDTIKKQVAEAHRNLVDAGLVFRTFGAASAIDRESGQVVIKPSGVSYDKMKPRDMVVVSLDDGRVVEGEFSASADTDTHLELYRAFDCIGAVVHTHSIHATAWAQAQRDIPLLGVTHANHFMGDVPCTRQLNDEEIRRDYASNTARVIVERFGRIDPLEIQAVLVHQHGPFAWGVDIESAVENAVVLEYLARLASETLRIEPYPKPVSPELVEKHFSRKHGPKAHYGQE